MPLIPFKIRKAPSLKQFLLLSLYIHIGVGLFQALLPADPYERRQLPPVKVTYLPPEEKTEPQKAPMFVDVPEPEKKETPVTTDNIARYDSRAHSNKKVRKHLVYQNNKTAIPRPKKSPSKSAATSNAPVPVKPSLHTQPAPKPLPESDRGYAIPRTRGEVTREQTPKRIEGGALALLDGFDPDKYAKLNTQSPVPSDDEEVISLDTRESKYAAYFARIKRQIERVWGYPEEAQRRGIGGKLILRFQIAKDGTLMNVWLIDKSESILLDDAALRAIKDAAPYYPFPATIDRESISILVTFVYEPRYANTGQFPTR